MMHLKFDELSSNVKSLNLYLSETEFESTKTLPVEFFLHRKDNWNFEKFFPTNTTFNIWRIEVNNKFDWKKQFQHSTGEVKTIDHANGSNQWVTIHVMTQNFSKIKSHQKNMSLYVYHIKFLVPKMHVSYAIMLTQNNSKTQNRIWNRFIP